MRPAMFTRCSLGQSRKYFRCHPLLLALDRHLSNARVPEVTSATEGGKSPRGKGVLLGHPTRPLATGALLV